MAVQLYTQSSNHGLHALVGYEDGTVVVWDALKGTLLARERLHDEPVMAVAVTADGSGNLLTKYLRTCPLLPGCTQYTVCFVYNPATSTERLPQSGHVILHSRQYSCMYLQL